MLLTKSDEQIDCIDKRSHIAKDTNYVSQLRLVTIHWLSQHQRLCFSTKYLLRVCLVKHKFELIAYVLQGHLTKNYTLFVLAYSVF